MITKQIVFTAPNTAELVEREVSQPKGNEVLVETEYSAISAGTERANLVGLPNVDGVASKDNMPTKFPRYQGYSSCGKVIAVGDKVKYTSPGDRVLVYFGHHSRYNLVPESKIFKINHPKVSSREACFVIIAGFPLNGIRKVDLRIGESALIMGLGLLGLFGVQLCRAAGAAPVIAADPNPVRRRLALDLGADYALNPLEDNFTQEIKSLTDGKGVNATIEVTGIASALSAALDSTARNGKVSLLGCTRVSDFPIDFYRQVHVPGISIVGAHNHTRPSYESSQDGWTFRDDCETLFRLIESKRVSILPMISEEHSPLEAPEVYRRLAFDKDFPLGVCFNWTKL